MIDDLCADVMTGHNIRYWETHALSADLTERGLFGGKFKMALDVTGKSYSGLVKLPRLGHIAFLFRKIRLKIYFCDFSAVVIF